VARFFNTYGPRMHPNEGQVVSNFIIQPCEEITLYGDGSQTPVFCYVDNPIDGLVRCIATSDDFSELATMIHRMINSRSRIVYRPLQQDDPVQRCPNIDLTRRVLDWQPCVPLEDGLMRMIAYFDWLPGRAIKGGREGTDHDGVGQVAEQGLADRLNLAASVESCWVIVYV
jgi:UDP-glucuronate decarboxylase